MVGGSAFAGCSGFVGTITNGGTGADGETGGLVVSGVKMVVIHQTQVMVVMQEHVDVKSLDLQSQVL